MSGSFLTYLNGLSIGRHGLGVLRRLSRLSGRVGQRLHKDLLPRRRLQQLVALGRLQHLQKKDKYRTGCSSISCQKWETWAGSNKVLGSSITFVMGFLTETPGGSWSLTLVCHPFLSPFYWSTIDNDKKVYFPTTAIVMQNSCCEPWRPRLSLCCDSNGNNRNENNGRRSPFKCPAPFDSQVHFVFAGFKGLDFGPFLLLAVSGRRTNEERSQTEERQSQIPKCLIGREEKAGQHTHLGARGGVREAAGRGGGRGPVPGAVGRRPEGDRRGQRSRRDATPLFGGGSSGGGMARSGDETQCRSDRKSMKIY